MGRALQFDPEPVWKVAGFCLLLASFAVTGWLLGVAAVALDGFLDGFFALIDNGDGIFHHAPVPFAG